MHFRFILIGLFMICCQSPAQNKAVLITPGSTFQHELVPGVSTHIDNGKPYFSFTLVKNNAKKLFIESTMAQFSADEHSITIQLDSSRQLMANGDLLNIYIAAKTKNSYPVRESYTRPNFASMLLSFSQGEEYKPSLSPSKGTIEITGLESNSCSGKFRVEKREATGDNYILYGEFQNARNMDLMSTSR